MTIEEQSQYYLVAYDENRVGWCVFKKLSLIYNQYHAGPFSEYAVAASEAKRLNELAADSTH